MDDHCELCGEFEAECECLELPEGAAFTPLETERSELAARIMRLKAEQLLLTAEGFDGQKHRVVRADEGSEADDLMKAFTFAVSSCEEEEGVTLHLFDEEDPLLTATRMLTPEMVSNLIELLTQGSSQDPYRLGSESSSLSSHGDSSGSGDSSS